MGESARIVGRGAGFGALGGVILAEAVWWPGAVGLSVVGEGEDLGSPDAYLLFVVFGLFAAVIGAVPGCVVGLLGGVVFALGAPNLVGRPGRVRLAGLLVGPGLNLLVVPYFFLSDAWWVPLGLLVGMGLLGMWFAPRVLYGKPAGGAG